MQSRIELTHHKRREALNYIAHTHTHTHEKEHIKARPRNIVCHNKKLSARVAQKKRRRPQIVANTERPVRHAINIHFFRHFFFVVTFNLAQARHISEIHLVFIMTMITIIAMMIMSIKAGQKNIACRIIWLSPSEA